MGFPEWFRVDLDFGLATGGKPGKAQGAVDGNRFYAQIGNAVCPPVVTALAEPLLEQMHIEGLRDSPELSASRVDSMMVDGHSSKRKREAERQSCATRPVCGCARVFVPSETCIQEARTMLGKP